MNQDQHPNWPSVTVKRIGMALVAALEILCLPSLRADTFFSNLGQSTTGGSGLDHTSDRLAASFFTGASATTITNATLYMGNPDNIGHHYTLSLFTAGSGGTPGALVGSFETIFIAAFSFTPPYVVGNHSFTSGGISLAPDTAYWGVLRLDEGITNSDSYWDSTTSQATDAGSVFSTIPGASLAHSTDSGASWSLSGANNLKFSLSGMVVPEPATCALVGSGLLTLLAFRQSRTSLRIGNRKPPSPTGRQDGHNTGDSTGKK